MQILQRDIFLTQIYLHFSVHSSLNPKRIGVNLNKPPIFIDKRRNWDVRFPALGNKVGISAITVKNNCEIYS